MEYRGGGGRKREREGSSIRNGGDGGDCGTEKGRDQGKWRTGVQDMEVGEGGGRQ